MSVQAWGFQFQEKLLSCSRSERTEPRKARVVGLATVTADIDYADILQHPQSAHLRAQWYELYMMR